VFGTRIAHDRRENRWDAAPVARDRAEIDARACHELRRRETDFTQVAERHVDVDGLADRTSQIRLERITESSVVVLVRAQRVHDVLRSATPESVFAQESIDQPGVAQDEVPGTIHIDVCHAGEVTCFATAEVALGARSPRP
jgi:hypothetical protein